MVVFVLSACSLNEKAADAPDVGSLEELAITTRTPPSESGAFVVRYQGEGFIALTLVDERTNLTATIGYPDVFPNYCGGGYPVDILDVLDVIAGNNEERPISLLTGDTQTRVYEGTPDLDDFSTWCPFYEGTTVLAEGIATINSTHNDVFETDQTIIRLS